MRKGKSMVRARSVEESTVCSRAYKEVRSLGRTHSLPLVSGAGSYTLAKFIRAAREAGPGRILEDVGSHF